ncbi:MAG: DUF362 domain-containing protein [archaeon]
MANVYFTKNISPQSVSYLFDKAFPKLIDKGDITAVKVHFGEYGNKTHIGPQYAREIVKKIKETGAKPFVTDSNALYKGHRHNAVDHLENARLNGFTYEFLGAPVIIADGLHGHDSRDIDINKKHFKSAKIASAIAESNSIVFATHFKGHMLGGFGGSIKNIAMGCASRAGKQQQHSTVKPTVDSNKCIKCKACGKWCPENAISYQKGPAFIDQKKCVGCNECVLSCPTSAIAVRWDTPNKDFQERMAEYAIAATKDKRCAFFNFLLNITAHCDCMADAGKPIMEDVGIFASSDPVSIDAACLDYIIKLKGNNIFEKIHGFDNTHQLVYGESIGLGSRKYKLILI